MMKERRQKSKIHCLPDELLYEIGALLDDADLCKTELTSRRLHDVLSKPSATVPGKHSLDLFQFDRETTGQFRSPAQA